LKHINVPFAPNFAAAQLPGCRCWFLPCCAAVAAASLLLPLHAMSSAKFFFIQNMEFSKDGAKEAGVDEGDPADLK